MDYPRVFFTVCISAFLVTFGVGVILPFLPLHAKELGASDTLVGLVVSSFFIMRVFTELPSGLLYDRMGRRVPILFGLSLSFLGALLCSLAVEPILLILGRTIWGSGTGFFFASSWGFLFDLFPLEVRGKALSVFQTIEFIGFTLGSPFGGFAVTYLEEKTLFLAVGLMMLVSLGLMAFSRELGGSEVKKAQHLFNFTPLRKWSFIVICMGAFVRMFISQGVVSTILPLYLEHITVTVAWIGIIIGVRSVGIILSTVLIGFIAHRVNLKIILLSGFLIDAVMLLLYTFTSNFEAFLPIGLFSGVASGVQMVSITLMLSHIVPKEIRGTGIGIYRTFFDAGGVAGPILLTALLSAVGMPLINNCFYAGTAMMFTSFLMVLTIQDVNVAREQ